MKKLTDAFHYLAPGERHALDQLDKGRQLLSKKELVMGAAKTIAAGQAPNATPVDRRRARKVIELFMRAARRRDDNTGVAELKVVAKACR